jgi:hypothetical protein
MKQLAKSLVFMMFLLCFMWQIAFSQLLYPNFDSKKDEYVPPYDPNVVIISPDVEKWMNEQLANDGEKRTVEIKTDLLGRAKSNAGKIVQSTKGAEVKYIAESPKQKRLVRISEMHTPQIEMEPMHGRYEYNPETKEHSYYLNDKKLSLKEYENIMEKYHEKLNSQNKGKRNLPVPGVINENELGWTALMTAEEISILIKNYKELAIDDYKEVTGGASASSILSTIQLSTHAWPNNYKGSGIGIHVVEANCSDSSFPIADPSRYISMCSGTTDTHHSKVVNVLQHAAPLARIIGFKGSSFPMSNSILNLFPAEIATHSYAQCLSQVTAAEAGRYKNNDMEMDNYIYNNRKIHFVGAGNKSNSLNCDGVCSPHCDTTSYVTSPGKALNAITVGAVQPEFNKYAWYSKWKNSEVGNEKPELAMYTNIDMGIYGLISGTSAATPLAAGFLATILSQHPFCKKQPAMMKASLMIAEKIPIQEAASFDLDNYRGAARGVVNYSTIAWGTGGAWWSGGNSSFFNSNNEITFIENNVQANRRHKIAIAWLSEGNYVLQNKRIQQDLDLRVYQNGQLLASSSSASNPFEIVDFVPPSNAPLTIVIYRFRNGGGNVVLGYNINYNH